MIKIWSIFTFGLVGAATTTSSALWFTLFVCLDASRTGWLEALEHYFPLWTNQCHSLSINAVSFALCICCVIIRFMFSYEWWIHLISSFAVRIWTVLCFWFYSSFLLELPFSLNVILSYQLTKWFSLFNLESSMILNSVQECASISNILNKSGLNSRSLLRFAMVSYWTSFSVWNSRPNNLISLVWTLLINDLRRSA